MTPNAIGVVPARLGSTRFPGKVLRDIAGKPMVIHALERLSAATRVTRALVATDSADVEREVRRFGGDVVLVTEPCETGSDRVARALAGSSYDIAVNLQADQPLVDPRDIDRAVDALASDETLDLATLAYRDEDEASFQSRDSVKVVTDAGGNALYFSRAPIPGSKGPAGKTLFLHHVGIYCFRRASLERFAALPRSRLETSESLEQLRALEAGMTIRVLVVDQAVPDVDRPSDVEAVERALRGV